LYGDSSTSSDPPAPQFHASTAAVAPSKIYWVPNEAGKAAYPCTGHDSIVSPLTNLGDLAGAYTDYAVSCSDGFSTTAVGTSSLSQLAKDYGWSTVRSWERTGPINVEGW
jgi:hypothetical protein